MRNGIGHNGRPGELFACGICTILLAVVLQGYWVSLTVPFSGLAVLNLRMRAALPVIAMTLGLAAVVLLLQESHVVDVVNLVLGGASIVFIYFFVGWLGALYREVVQASKRFTYMAVLEERLRFARDLHDLLGHSLSVIALKSELATRLIHEQPERARGEVESVTALSKRSIADVREVARGYRTLSLVTEIEGVRGALQTAGIRVTVSDVPEGLAEPVQEAFGWVVREGCTNILQHSSAVSCDIRVWIDGSHVRFRMTNDGADPGVPRRGQGSGLAGLARRMRTVGGELSHGYGPGGTYAVDTVVPLPQEEPPGPPGPADPPGRSGTARRVRAEDFMRKVQRNVRIRSEEKGVLG
ncbi:sensor histidine kinase [Streptomyces sp. NPDC048172]|uniref:sensor histidine kinase n=1 Tax=Streptomyces sp. NPDC048172 TaxID=3365505 RepID=UPI003722F495